MNFFFENVFFMIKKYFSSNFFLLHRLYFLYPKIVFWAPCVDCGPPWDLRRPSQSDIFCKNMLFFYKTYFYRFRTQVGVGTPSWGGLRHISLPRNGGFRPRQKIPENLSTQLWKTKKLEQIYILFLFSGKKETKFGPAGNWSFNVAGN